MDVGFYLGELLMQQGEVSVPGLGYFVLARMGGYYDESERKFYPPYHRAQFDIQFIEDDSLAEYIAAKKNISVASAKYFCEKYINNLKLEAKANEVPIGNLGTFYNDLSRLTFKPADKIIDDAIFFGFEPVKINKADPQHVIAERPRVQFTIPPVPVTPPAVIEEETEEPLPVSTPEAEPVPEPVPARITEPEPIPETEPVPAFEQTPEPEQSALFEPTPEPEPLVDEPITETAPVAEPILVDEPTPVSEPIRVDEPTLLAEPTPEPVPFYSPPIVEEQFIGNDIVPEGYEDEEEYEERRGPLRLILIVLAVTIVIAGGVFALYRYQPDTFAKMVFWKQYKSTDTTGKPKGKMLIADPVKLDTPKIDTNGGVAKDSVTKPKATVPAPNPVTAPIQPGGTKTPAAGVKKDDASLATKFADATGTRRFEVLVAPPYNNIAAANAALIKLRGRGLDAKIVPDVPGPLKHISVGNFKTLLEATTYAEKISQSGKVTNDVYPQEIIPQK